MACVYVRSEADIFDHTYTKGRLTIEFLLSYTSTVMYIHNCNSSRYLTVRGYRMDSNFLLPWEYRVCPQCLRQNPHAIWLVKYGCFERSLHKDMKGTEPVNVVIVQETMEMVRLRPLPSHSSFDGQFIVCRFKDNCRRGYSCKSPHSKAEKDAWNAKKYILNGKF